MQEETPTPQTLSRLIDSGSEPAILHDISKIRAEMAENFHLYQEVKALPTSDKDLLFELIWRAQQGDREVLQDIFSLVYDELPVDIVEFIESSRYLNLKGQINAEKLELLEKFARPQTRKMWVAAGSGGGKSFMVSIAMTWMIYNLMCLKRPDMFYMLGPRSKVAIINLSVGKEQSKDVIFSEFLARLEHSRYFKNKYEALSAQARFPKRVFAFSGGSGVTAYFGYHTIMGSLDEASHMLDRNDKSLAESLTEALLKSLNTRFPNAYKLFVISTLRSPDDFLNSQIERIKEEGIVLVNRPLVI